MTRFDGNKVSLTIGNWLGIIGLAVAIVASIINQTNTVARLEVAVQSIDHRVEILENR